MIESSEIDPTSASGNIFLDTLTFRYAFVPGIQITYVLQGKPGDGSFGGTTWATGGARSAFQQALTSWSAVANVSFVESALPYNGTGSTDAYDWIEAFKTLDSDLAAEHELPHTGVLAGSFDQAYFAENSLAVGSLRYSVFVHEIGHGLGLLHPHNDGDEPAGDPVFPGVSDADDLGTNSLNQGIFSVMTYNSGFSEVGYSLSEDFGWEAGPMAFDIAAVQRLYGANTATNSGNSSYTLPQASGAGTYWSCIWDASGTDTIDAGSTTLDAIIDLRAATLLPEFGGGGFASRISGVLGGFTIANGVVIENAVGGAGDDRIHGNAASNRLDGGGGYDIVDYSGTDTDVIIDLAAQVATGEGTDTLVSIEAAIGGNGNDKLTAIDGIAPGGVGDVFKRGAENIASTYSAIDLDYRFVPLTGSPTVPGDAGMASVQVHAQSGFGTDYYSFFVETGGPVYIDVDNTFGLDTTIRVFDQSGAVLGSNDNGGALDPGSVNFLDPYLVLQNVQGGQRLFVQINGSYEYGTALRNSYDLNISLATSRLGDGSRSRGSRLDGGDGNDTLVGGRGDDVLIGGNGFDTLILAGASADYQIVESGHREFTFESAIDGRDKVIDVERFRFTDGNFNWLPTIGLRREHLPPVIQPIAPLTTIEGGSVQFTAVASDEDSASWHFVFGDVPGGRLSEGPGGTLVFTPFADAFGETTFAVTAIDSDGYQSVSFVILTITPVNDAPRWATPSQRIFSSADEETLVLLDISDPDDEVVTISPSKPVHGKLTETFNGNYIYTPDAGFAGIDTFTLTAVDPHGASAQQVVTIDVQAPDDWRAFLPDLFGGELGGDGTVYGTLDHQAVRILDLPGRITFDGSFNRGGDIIRLPGNASAWTVYASGANAVFVHGGTQVIVPTGGSSTAVAFADGTRMLRFDWTEADFMLGDQIIDQVATTITAASAGSQPTIVTLPEETGRLFVTAGGTLPINGRVAVFGTEMAEYIHLKSGDVVFDGSFNKGGDVIFIDRPASSFSAAQSGSNLVLESQTLDVTIPFGATGTTLSFQGDQRTLVYDRDQDALLLGPQAIGTEPIIVSSGTF